MALDILKNIGNIVSSALKEVSSIGEEAVKKAKEKEDEPLFNYSEQSEERTEDEIYNLQQKEPRLDKYGSYVYKLPDGTEIKVKDFIDTEVYIDPETAEIFIYGAKDADIKSGDLFSKINIYDSSINNIDMSGGNDNIYLENTTINFLKAGDGDDTIKLNDSTVKSFLEAGEGFDVISLENETSVISLYSEEGGKTVESEDAIYVDDSSSINIFNSHSLKSSDSESFKLPNYILQPEKIGDENLSQLLFTKESFDSRIEKYNTEKENKKPSDIKVSDSIKVQDVEYLGEEELNISKNVLLQLASKYTNKELTAEELQYVSVLDSMVTNFENLQEQFKKQEDSDGWICDGYNWAKELTGLGITNEDISKAIEKQGEYIAELKASIDNGNFPEVYEKCTGVKYDPNIFMEYQEANALYMLYSQGVMKAENFRSNLYKASSVGEAFQVYIDYYGDAETAREKINEHFEKLYKDDSDHYRAYVNDKYELVYEQQLNGESKWTYCSSFSIYNLNEENPFSANGGEFYSNHPVTEEFVAQFESVMGIKEEEFLNDYVQIQQKILGKSNTVQKLLDSYCIDQNTFSDRVSSVIQIAGTGVMIVGGCVTFVCPPAGAIVTKVGSWVSFSGMFTDEAMDMFDALTSETGLTAEELYKITEDTIIDLALYFSGRSIGNMSNGINDIVLDKTQSAILAKLAEIGTDATMSIITDAVLTGNVSLTSEGISQLLSVITGCLGAKAEKLNKAYAEADVYVKNGDLDTACAVLKEYGLSQKRIDSYSKDIITKQQKAMTNVEKIACDGFSDDSELMNTLTKTGMSEQEASDFIINKRIEANKVLTEAQKYIDMGDIDGAKNYISNSGLKMTDSLQNLILKNNGISYSETKNLISKFLGDSKKSILSYFDKKNKRKYLSNLKDNNGNLIFNSNSMDYMMKLSDSGVDTSNFEMLIDLVQNGVVGRHVFDHLPKEGKLSASVVADIDRLYNAYVEGIEPIDAFVPKINSESDAISSLSIGDTFQLPNEDFIRIKTSDTESKQLNISRETYFNLFPPVERYSTTQNAIGNCWELTGINSLLCEPDTRASVLSLFSEDGNDIVIKFPNGEFEEIRFTDGKLPEGENPDYYSKGAQGINMIEYAEGREMQATKINDAYNKFNELIMNASTPEIKARLEAKLMEFTNLVDSENGNVNIKVTDNDVEFEVYSGKYDNAYTQSRNGGYQYWVYERLGLQSANVTYLKDVDGNPLLGNKKFLQLKSSFDNYVVSWATKKVGKRREKNIDISRGIVSTHAYRLKPAEVDEDGNIVSFNLVNPWGVVEVELSIDEIFEYGSSISYALKG